MQPCYKWWEAPYFWAGLRMYDLIAGSQGLEWCRFLTPSQVGGLVGGCVCGRTGGWLGAVKRAQAYLWMVACNM